MVWGRGMTQLWMMDTRTRQLLHWRTIRRAIRISMTVKRRMMEKKLSGLRARYNGVLMMKE
jgi:hypothetical protein